MTRDLHTSFVRLLDRRSQHFAAHIRVELEPCHSLGSPVVHHATYGLGTVHLVHAAHTLAPGQIWTGDVHPRAGDLPGIDEASQIQLGVR
jgi:hypothetical protein